MFRQGKRRRRGRKRAATLPRKVRSTQIIQFPQPVISVQDFEEYPDYETVSRWLRLADEMLGSAESRGDNLQDGDDRKQA
jgi:hypothetical protein